MKTKDIMNIILAIAVIAVLAILGNYVRGNNNSVNQNAAIDPDQSVIEQLIKHGSDPEKEHLIEFAFQSDSDNLSKLKEELSLQGYTYDARQSERDPKGDAGYWLIMSKPYKLHLDELKIELAKMEVLANKYNVTFDGWSAGIVR